jgi:hypothetical protein
MIPGGDGIVFDEASIEGEEIRAADEYAGVRVRLEARLAEARIPMQVDVGFGDVIVPDPTRRSYPTLLDHPPPLILVYPLEAVVAEKLEAMVSLGVTNSRMMNNAPSRRSSTGVGDDGAIVGIERDQLESDDKFMRHLAQVVRNGLGDRAGTCIDPKTQIVQGKTVCVVSCQRSPEPVFLKWKDMETSSEGDFFVRSGPGTVKLDPDSAREYIRTRFAGWSPPGSSMM